MREYETMIIARSDLPEAELSKMVSRWESIIGNQGGEVIKKDAWGVRRLAYEINKQSRGNYFLYDVATTQDNIIELQRILKLDENVLRSLIVKLDDSVNVETRKIEIQKAAEEAVEKAHEAAREKAESESVGARRGNHASDE